MPAIGTSITTLPVCLPGCAAAIVVMIVSVAGAVLARGSTAVPAAVWALAAGLCLAVEMGCHAAGRLADPGTALAVRLLTAAVAVCPTMALLGAKRPQHGVWQFIVASLAVVLAMPALSATLVRPGTPPDIHVLERCFLLALAVVGWMNFIGTRHAVAAGLATAGLVVLSRGLLPFALPVPGSLEPWLDDVAAVAIAAGATLALIQSANAGRGGRHQAAAAGLAARVDPPFLALRETLGTAWTLRIAERFNTIAEGRGWPCRLSFRGLDEGGDPLDTAWHRDALRAFRAIMSRFVTADWLRRHGGG